MTLYDTAVRRLDLPAADRVRSRSAPPRKPRREHVRADIRMMSFRADVEQSPDVQLVRLHGELDAASVGILNEMISCERQIAAGRQAELHLDLRAVTFMDPVALDVLLRATRASNSSGQAFTVGAASEPVLRLLKKAQAADLLGDAERLPA